MKHIIKKLALLFVPVYLWFAFFVAFEPNNYFGIKKTASSSQPVARVRAYEQSPGTNLIIGDSRLAHFDMDLVDSLTGQSWQNLAFGGASLKECVDLANYVLDSGNQVDRILFELSFYTLNSSYNTDRFSALEATLRNPLAYCLNLEYNVNALTVFMDTVKGTPDTIESGDWTAADYLDDAGNTIPLHKKLYEYPALITTHCQNWTLNETELAEFLAMAQRCADRWRGADHCAAPHGRQCAHRGMRCLWHYRRDAGRSSAAVGKAEFYRAELRNGAPAAVPDDDTQFLRRVPPGRKIRPAELDSRTV